MLLHQKMEAVNPPDIPFGGFTVCVAGVFSSAAAHARHADEIVRIGLLCASVQPMLGMQMKSYWFAMCMSFQCFPPRGHTEA